MQEAKTIPGAKLVGGVWLPETEQHLDELMLKVKRRFVDGKATYQYHKLEMALKHLPTGRQRTALDIGAHCGLWSMHLAKIFAELHAFEPVPLHCECFEANVLNGGKHRAVIALRQFALGDENKFVEFDVPDETTGNSHVSIGHKHPGARGVGVAHPERYKSVQAEMRRLDSFGFSTVDFIKIDVEGYELPVLRGGRDTILENKPIIVLEQKGNDEVYGFAKDAALEYCVHELGMRKLDHYSGDWVLGW